MPSILRIGIYCIYFWSNENNEPIHVHIAFKTPTSNATKVWLTEDGRCRVCHNKSKIPDEKLLKILEVLEDNHYLIVEEWKRHFGTDSISFID